MISVNTFTDELNSDGDFSLREAISATGAYVVFLDKYLKGKNEAEATTE